MSQIPIIKLVPPDLSELSIKERITCIRGHRERIFQVYFQQLEDKLIFHNYGHGGAGWTFLFGCVNKSLDQFEDFVKNDSSLKAKEITVVGAGCYGLLTAATLKSRGYKVKIVAQDLNSISSNKAAGFFFPRHRKCSNQQEVDEFQRASLESYKTYLDIINGKHPFIKFGPKIIPAYYGLDIDPGFEPLIENDLIYTPKRVKIDFGHDKIYDAFEYNVVFINPALIMDQLWSFIKNNNIQVQERVINSFAQLDDDIIFNCSGYGSKILTDDKRIVPVQGHLITLKNQNNINDLQYMINFKVVMVNDDGSKRDELIYFAPKDSGILGITFIRGQDDLNANYFQFDRLLRRSKDFFGT